MNILSKSETLSVQLEEILLKVEPSYRSAVKSALDEIVIEVNTKGFRARFDECETFGPSCDTLTAALLSYLLFYLSASEACRHE